MKISTSQIGLINLKLRGNEEGVWAILEVFSCVEISRERKVQVLESFESFCCEKTGRELSEKRKPS